MSQPLLSNKLQIKPARRPDSASGLLTAAALLWLPQAAALALAVQRLAAGQGFSAVVMPALAVLLLGVLRAALEAGAARLAFAAARQQVTQLRFQVAQALAARSPLDCSRPASGLAASVIAEQAEAVVPWLVRYQPARWRVALVLPCIAVVVLYVSWAAALVLVLAAPLIPLFMALVGWRAQAASQVHLQEQGNQRFRARPPARPEHAARAGRGGCHGAALAHPRPIAAPAHDGGAADCFFIVRCAGAVRCAGRGAGGGLHWFSPAGDAELWRVGSAPEFG